MPDPPVARPRKVPLVFYRSDSGADPVKDWLKTLPSAERQLIGQDLMRVQWRWPVGMPLCRPMGQGLWEVRSSLPGNRIAACSFARTRGLWWHCMDRSRKTPKTPLSDLKLTRKRMKEVKE